MTKFEEIGVNRQYDSSNMLEAKQNFENSCEICCSKGLWIKCERCAIAHTHNQVKMAFDAYVLMAH